MSDIIFKTKGEETFRISHPTIKTIGTKCPETKLEIKMTEQKITLNLTLEELKLIDKYVDYSEETKELFDKLKEAYPQPRIYYVNEGKVEIVTYNDKVYYRLDLPDEVYWYISKRDDNDTILLKQITDGETHRLLEGLWFNQVQGGVIDEPEHYDEVEWDEKDNPASYMTDEVVDKMLKKWEENPPEFLKFELGKTLEDLIARWWLDTDTDHKDWDVPTCVDDLVDQIQLWLPREQSHEGTQDASVIDLVDGYNDALRKIKSKLRNKK